MGPECWQQLPVTIRIHPTWRSSHSDTPGIFLWQNIKQFLKSVTRPQVEICIATHCHLSMTRSCSKWLGMEMMGLETRMTSGSWRSVEARLETLWHRWRHWRSDTSIFTVCWLTLQRIYLKNGVSCSPRLDVVLGNEEPKKTEDFM